MAFKSHAQREKYKELVKSGKMKQETYDAHDRETEHAKLPERLVPKEQKVKMVRVIK